jgi:hypothetical protein
VTFSASGTGLNSTPISASATFDFGLWDFGAGATNAIKITLSNTAADTNFSANLLTGVFWSMTGSVSNADTSSAGFDGRAATVKNYNTNGPGPGDDTVTTSTNVDIAPALASTSTENAYQLSNGPFTVDNNNVSFSAFRFGISTVGAGLTGFNGADVDGDKYGIAAAGSLNTPNDWSDGLPPQTPLVDGSAIFYIKPPTGWDTLSQVSAVRFIYGSGPAYYLDCCGPGGNAPAPGSLALLGLGLTGLLGFRLKKKS